LGTCGGGTLAGQCCDVTFNCDSGVACVGSQKVCFGGGPNDGFSCLRSDQCAPGQCGSTGQVCKTGLYAGFTCGQDADCCPGDTCPGACFSPAAVPTPTATASRTGTVATPTPTPSVKVTATATVGASPTAPTVTPRPTAVPHRTQTPPQGLLIRAVGEGGGCATAAEGGSWSLALLTGAIALWVARRRSGVV
jgi:hypothetical protein